MDYRARRYQGKHRIWDEWSGVKPWWLTDLVVTGERVVADVWWRGAVTRAGTVIGPGVAIECHEAKNGLHIFEDHFIPEIIDPVSRTLCIGNH